MSEEAVSAEQAELEFDLWCEAMDLDVDVKHMDEDDLQQFQKQKRRICKAIQSGALTFNSDTEAVYVPQKSGSKYREPITFHERTGSAVMAMDGKRKGKDVAKTYAVMEEMCKVPRGTFAGLVGVDSKVCEALFALLMD